MPAALAIKLKIYKLPVTSQATQDHEMEIAAFVCSHVFNKIAPVLLVSKEGGDWQFLCGAIHNPGDKPRAVGLKHLTDDDPSLNEILDLPSDWEAEREALTLPWRKSEVKT